MNSQPKKILALQFKYFGDAVMITPALRALRLKYPHSEIHVLVPEEIAPLFQCLPWLDRVWPIPRHRGRASLRETWPFIRALRREKFDYSVDFASNDRGALLSFIIGAKRRLGWAERGGFLGRKLFYNDRVAPEKNLLHESVRLTQLLSGWKIPPPDSFAAEICSDPTLVAAAKKILPENDSIVCHVATSQPKKEWPLEHWAKLDQHARAAGLRLVFTTARGEREAALMTELKKIAPEAVILPAILELSLFLAVLNRAAVFISGDTGPLHFAAGLGVPTISLYGPSSPARWAPLGAKHQVLTGGVCNCDGHTAVCLAARHCLAEISPEQVFAALQNKISARCILESRRPCRSNPHLAASLP